MDNTHFQAAPGHPPRSFVLALLLLLVTVLFACNPQHKGDSVEYTLATVAIASHGTPDIRYADIATARSLMPQPVPVYDMLERDMRAGKQEVYAAFVRGREGQVYSVHFFGYPALAAIPYKLLQLAHLPPFKCYQVLNLAGILVLGLCLYRLFGSSARAALGLALYMLCGGALYLNWSSPESLSAAALLSALILYCTGAPLWGGLLAGLAAQQNPTILFFFGFAPLLHIWLLQGAGMAWRAALRQALAPRQLVRLAPGLALLALPPLFNLWQFGVPSIIVKLFTDPDMVSLARLHSFFFDLNQGMIIGVPALLAALALWAWRGSRVMPGLLVLCAALTLALVLPTLAMLNWNSDAAGVMRYAFWAAMPLLFALLWRLRQYQRWPVALCTLLLAAQAGAMVHANSYKYESFSPLAQWVMQHAPGWYNPDPEIFSERAQGAELPPMHQDKIYAYKVHGVAFKTMYHGSKPVASAMQCGAGQVLSTGGAKAAPDITAGLYGWDYLNDTVRCATPVTVGLDKFLTGPAIMLGDGWSVIERGDSHPTGVWSDGNTSSLQFIYPQSGTYSEVVVRGSYFEGNQRTRVIINGKDLGWHDLSTGTALAIPKAAGASSLRLELAHEAPRSPGPHDGRKLAFFMMQVGLQ